MKKENNMIMLNVNSYEELIEKCPQTKEMRDHLEYCRKIGKPTKEKSKLRKNVVFVLLPKDTDYEELDKCFDGIYNKLLKNSGKNMYKTKNGSSSYVIFVNGYQIHILNGLIWNKKGLRAELTYVYNNFKTYNEEEQEFFEYDICGKTKMYSTRKEIIRYINSWEDIDFRELLDDKYAIDNKCV